MTWQTKSSRIAYENPWMRVREHEVVRPDGSDGLYGVMEMVHPAVFVVALTEADEVLLIETFRYTTQRVSIEVPAGGTDGEEPLLAAQRELAEETGMVAGSWTPLGQVWALNGLARAEEHVYLARDLRPAENDGAGHRAAEGITAVRRIPWPEVMRMVRDGEIRDAQSITPLMLAALALGRVR